VPELPAVEATKPSRREREAGRVRVDRSSGANEHVDEFTIDPGDPLSAHVRCTRSFHVARTRVETESELRADEHRFLLRNRVRALDGGDVVHEEERRVELPRPGRP
jgi:hypothetical protein